MKKFFTEIFGPKKSSDNKMVVASTSTFDANLYPDEIWLHIFTYLLSKELCRLAKTSKRFKQISEDQGLWLNLIHQFLTLEDPITTKSYKNFCAELNPVFKAFRKSTNFREFEDQVGVIKLKEIANLDIYLKSFLDSFVTKKLQYEYETNQIGRLFTYAPNNWRSLTVLINHFGVQDLKDCIEKLPLLREHIYTAFLRVFSDKNKESLKLLFKLGIGQGAKADYRKLTMTFLAASVLYYDQSVDEDFRDFIFEQSNSRTLELTVSNLLGDSYSSLEHRNSWFELVTNKPRTVEHTLLKIYQQDNKHAEIMLRNLSIIITFDMDLLLTALLTNNQETLKTTFDLSLIALEALKRDSINVFTSLLKFKTLKEMCSQNPYHVYIDNIANISKNPSYIKDHSIRISSALPTSFDTTSNFCKGVPANLTKFIDLFTKNGVDINAVNEKGDTVLEAAILTGCAPLVTSLLKNGAVITAKALKYSEQFPSIKDTLELVDTLQKKIPVQINNTAVNNNNNNATGLTTHGVFTILPIRKPQTKQELRDHYVEFYTSMGKKD